MGDKGEAIKQRIVTAADELFYIHGYDNTSFSEIANAVGISRGNFYYHFKSKDEILNEVIATRLDSYRSMLNDWDKSITDPRLRLNFYIDMQLRNQDNILSHGCPVGTLCSELAKTGHSHLAEANRMLALFRDWIVTQLKLLGVKKNTKIISMHLLARGQGIATVTNAFEDKKFLQQEVKGLKQWLDEEIQKSIH